MKGRSRIFSLHLKRISEISTLEVSQTGCTWLFPDREFLQTDFTLGVLIQYRFSSSTCMEYELYKLIWLRPLYVVTSPFPQTLLLISEFTEPC